MSGRVVSASVAAALLLACSGEPFADPLDGSAPPADGGAPTADAGLAADVSAADGGDSGGEGGSAAPCAEALRAFVSSTRYTGSLGGRAGADVRCKALADAAGLGAGAAWAAWLSTGGANAIDRLPLDATWCLVDRSAIVGTRADLARGALAHAVDRFETGVIASEPGATAPPAVWTGTLGTGLAAANHCDGWTRDGLATLGARGDYTALTAEWTNWPPQGALPAVSCNNLNRIYCFETE